MPEYGMGFEPRFDEPPAAVEPLVETDDWSAPIRVERAAPARLRFVDGVRRIDLRLRAYEGGTSVPGLFGTYAVGVVRCDERATFGEHAIGRALVLGGGVLAERITVRCGSALLDYEPRSVPESDPDQPLFALQRLMREAEGNLAARVATETDALVVVDGPLAFFEATPCPVVGVVKRFGREYLDPPERALIPRLRPGERTPLFAIEEPESRRRRYAWYTRIAELRVPWHEHAGVVRCEVRAGLGIVEAASVADRLTAILPLHAGRASDPRTPQNLVPVAGLETWLRHRAGDARLVRRALLAWIAEAPAA